MKPKSKILSLLLTICLVVGLMPTVVFAAGIDTGKAIQLVDSGTAANIDGTAMTTSITAHGTTVPSNGGFWMTKPTQEKAGFSCFLRNCWNQT